ncbi:GH92 family glycosyl hydrolase [Dyadobacter fanqingshengii]|uniref:GH92 family glycosyl hydrolase n=1 Tax=Dyadobacter fanqingshengii TaxID=2906443 RepID=A0A9X1T8C0_9BACT|nr:GH92 family glycosyl hydrolase [Dyadobacter fanqingshengii]MCF0039303.1 GH92 family glycosyl hydrolase [Dyadobacter fanqingshengii]USJ33880.1 GH92 family glycosyl hydrolase [Dyadobacter fanqingshengii]
MKKILQALNLVFATTSFLFAQKPADNDFVDLVNPLMGTQSKFSLSSGNTYPAIALPWAMNFWMPQTGKMGDGWAYMYDAEKIRGFKQTHQPSPWINDYGQFSIMPVTGKPKIDEESRASWFSHKAEVAKPHYYKVYLADHDVTTEIAPTERAAQFRFTFPQADSSFVLIDAFDKGSYIKIIPAERKIIGYTTKNSGGVPANFKNYFVVVFDKAFTFSSAFHGKTLAKDTLELKAGHVGAVVGFKTKKGEQIGLKVASSFISPEQAELNLQREIANDNFEATKEKGRQAWNTELSRIQVEGDNKDQIRTFYSCLYRVLLFPRKFYEFDKANKIVHYSPYSGEVKPGYMFTDNGFWDTFRAVFPFFTLMYPTLNAHIMEGLANAYDESGYLPEWASPGHRDCMIGSNSASLIADSYVKGIRGYDINKLYEAVIKNTENAGPVSSVGRFGHEYYNELGYVPYDVKVNENAARTLEYAYADFCIAQLGTALKKPQKEVDLYLKRSQNYRNVFDPETKWMRGKNKDGQFQKPFNPFKWGDAFTEGNSIHYTWSVFQDVKGLIGLVGGREAFVQKLDTVFTLPPIFDDSYYGFPIHEIREMQIMNMGNYAHGNQPIQHMIYLYNYAGAPYKAQYWLRQVMNKLYQAAPDGYCGDEDNGQTSAWYVFSSLGFYPVTPGTTQYVIGSPLFKKATLTMEDGKKFTVQAPASNDANMYIQGASLNGKTYGKTFLEHADIQKGGSVQFNMGSQPSKTWGASADAAPFSLTK